MVTVPIHQDTSLVPPMTTLVIDLTAMQSDSPLPTSTGTTSIITTTTILPTPQPQQSTTDLILVRRIGELEQHMVDLVQANLALGERLDKHGTRLYNLENLDIPHKVSQAVDEIVTDARMFEDDSYKANNVYKDLYEALQKSLESPLGSPPPPAGTSGAPGTSGASGSSQLPPPPPPPSTGTSRSTLAQDLSPLDDLMHDDSACPMNKYRPGTPEPTWTILPSNVSDAENNWASALDSSYEPPFENSLLAKTGDMTTFLNWYCRQINKSKLTQADSEGHAYEVVKVFYPNIIHLQFQIEECHKMLTDQVDWANPEGDQVRINVNRPLPLGGPPSHVTIQIEFFFNKD
ncbi:hypothetical protein Tco_1542600, partial [Tanacetum coccineum]